MGNLAELFVSFILASGQWAVPIQQISALDSSDSIQEPSPPTATSFFGLWPGDRVRFSTAKGQPMTEGNVVAADPGALLLWLRGVDEPVRIPWSSLRRLEAYRGQQSWAGRGAKIGALSVGIPWAALSYYGWLWGNNECFSNCPGGAALAGVVALGVGAGALVGYIIGALVEDERWDKLDLAPVWVSVTPQRGRGLALALSWRF